MSTMTLAPSRQPTPANRPPVAVFHVQIHPCTDTTGYWAACDMPNGGCVVQEETLWETKKTMFEAMAFYLEDYPEITDYDLAFEVCDA